MKKIFLSFVLSIFFVLSSSINAQTYVPHYVDLITSTSSQILNAGDDIDIKISLDKSSLPAEKTNIEYGVVRRIVMGTMTSYEPISIFKIEKAYSSSRDINLKAKVPNVLKNNSSTTYALYAKITVIDNSDAENFIVSKQDFKIQANTNIPLTKVQYINFLHSNNRRYSIISGPTIYDLSKTNYKDVASSTALEIVIKSNVDTVLNPTITFKKLRSDVVIPDIKTSPIDVKKGTSTLALIQMPTFNYEPGVYQGTIDFGNKNMIKVDFQYIVAGDSVTFGQPVYSKATSTNNHVLDFNIFGTPIDLNLNPFLNNISTSTTSLIYKTDFIVKDKNNKELYKITKDIDFSSTTYRLEIPSNIKNLIKVSIKTIDNNGRVVYEGTKDLNIPKDNTLKSVMLATLFVLVFVLLLIFKRKYLRVILFVIALTILGFWVSIAKADVWRLPFYWYLDYNNFGGDQTYVANSDWVSNQGFIFQFNTDVRNERYYTNEDIKITYQAIHEFCYNYYEDLSVLLTLSGSSYANNVGLHPITNIGFGLTGAIDYAKYAADHTWYFEYLAKYNVSPVDLTSVKADYIFDAEFTTLVGHAPQRSFQCYYDEEAYGDGWVGSDCAAYNDYLLNGPVGTSAYPSLVKLWTSVNLNYLYANYGKTCLDRFGCGGWGSSEIHLGSRRDIITRWMTENLGKPSTTNPVLYIKRIVAARHYSVVGYTIPLLNVVNQNDLSVTADNITPVSARINWVYTDTKPQTNYQIDLSTTDTFSTILQSKSYTPVTVNFFEKYFSKVNNFLGIKKANAAVDVADIRNITVDGLQQNTKYYVRVRIQNSAGWSNYSSISFTTSVDNTQTCICKNRDLVCVQSGVTSTTTNSNTCNITASCSVSTTTTNTIFNIIPTNLLGTATYTQTSGDTATANGGVFTMPIKMIQQSIGVSVADSYDGHNVSTTCSVDNSGNGLPPPPLLPPPPILLPPGPTFPKISLTKTPILSLKSGGSCTVTWSLTDIPTGAVCSLTSTDGSQPIMITSSGSQSFGPLFSNQKYTLTCSGAGLAKQLTSSVICRVNGEVKER